MVSNFSVSNSGTAASCISNATVTWTKRIFGSTISVNDGCTPVASRNVTISPYVTPSVSIDPSPDYIICSNTTLNFTATPVNGGTSPAYQWQENNGSSYVNIGTNSPNYSSNTPVNGDLIRCIMTSNVACPSPGVDTSNVTAMIVGACNNIWQGGTTDWFTPGNWSAGVVPTNCADGANFPPGLSNYPALTGNASCGNVLIQAGASINLQGHNLSVCGNWTAPSSGATITGTGVVIFDGITNATQAISGVTNLGEIKVDNTGGGQVVMQSGSKINLLMALDLQQGNINVTSGTLTFKSTIG